MLVKASLDLSDLSPFWRPHLSCSVRSVDDIHVHFIHDFHCANLHTCSHHSRRSRSCISNGRKGNDGDSDLLTYHRQLQGNPRLNKPVKLYPALDFQGLFLVLTTVSSASTSVRFLTQSFVGLYLSALVPLRLVPTMSSKMLINDANWILG